LPEAVALNAKLEALKADPKAVSLTELLSMTGEYYGASYDRIMSRPAVKEGLPLIFSAANASIVLLLLRLLLPRLLAIESMNDLYDFAPELGLPSKTELMQYIEYAQNMDYATKFLLFLLVICIEKVTLIGEFIPVGIVLPSISPVLFGGVIEGTLISAFCATFGSSINFVIGKNFLYERVLDLEIFGQPPVKNTTWYRALSANIEKDGFKAALLLRLAPVLPIPIDAHWYVSGCTPLKLPTFFCAYFVGALKATFLDAYLGSLLTSGLAGEEAVSGSTRVIVIVETVAILLVSVLVTQYALGLFNEMMQEEGYSSDDASRKNAESDRALVAELDAGFAVSSKETSMPTELSSNATDKGSLGMVAEGRVAKATADGMALSTEAAPAGRPSGAAASPTTVSISERGQLRLQQIASREAEIAARLRELNAKQLNRTDTGDEVR